MTKVQDGLSFGGGGKGEVGTEYMPEDARIVRLGKDLISLDSEIVETKAPYRTCLRTRRSTPTTGSMWTTISRIPETIHMISTTHSTITTDSL